jgi:5-formyltetrahydrofolate cyclo-ligase
VQVFGLRTPEAESTVLADKTEQRREALARRDAIEPAQRAAASRLIAGRLTDLPELRQAKVICCFVSFRTEVDTRPVIDWAHDHGREIVAPRITGPRTMEAASCPDPDDDLVPGRWDIPEPRPSLPPCHPETIDAMLVPGAAFDERGSRIGYGGGFYDTFMRLLRPGVPRIGLAFEAQLLPRVATEPHDLPVDVVVTERRVIRMAGSSRR